MALLTLAFVALSLACILGAGPRWDDPAVGTVADRASDAEVPADGIDVS